MDRSATTNGLRIDGLGGDPVTGPVNPLAMAPRIVILGAGFGGLELASALSAALGSDADVTVIDKADSFMFGYSKLEFLFGRASREELSLPYSAIAKPGVRFVHETITAIDPKSRHVTTDRDQYEADYLVVALGADMAYEATPGLRVTPDSPLGVGCASPCSRA
jgi:sulfide:quinone oxidoreductase